VMLLPTSIEKPYPASAAGRGGPAAAGNERLAAFERGTFDLGEELKGLGEKGINDLREQLSEANKECSEKIKRLLHQHYQAFISASKVHPQPLPFLRFFSYIPWKSPPWDWEGGDGGVGVGLAAVAGREEGGRQ